AAIRRGLATSLKEFTLTVGYRRWIEADRPLKPDERPPLTAGELIEQLRETRLPGARGGPLTMSDFPHPSGMIIAGSTPELDCRAMEELGRRGVDALPELVRHLTDDRETHVVVKPLLVMWFSDEYQARHRAPKRQPRGVNLVGFGSNDRVDSYTLRVGDVCF